MSTDLLTSVARSAGEAETMPHRLLALIPYPKTFALGVFSSIGSLFASITNEQATAVVLAIVAIGTVAAPPLRRFYLGLRAAKLEADTLEYETWHGKEQSTATKLGLAEGRLKAAEEQIERLAQQNREQQAQLDEARRLGLFAAKKAVKLKEQVEATDKRVDAVEAVQGSLSGDAHPITPVPPEPKT